MITLGIDPGITGAISIFDDDDDLDNKTRLVDPRLVDVFDLPTMQIGKSKQLNSSALSKLIKKYMYWTEWSPYSTPKMIAYVEKVGAMPGQGVTSIFNFGMGYGAIQGVLAAHHIPYKLVTPQKWKKYYNLTGKDKDCARTLAIQQFPKAELNLKKHIGRADAILIGQYGVKNEKK